MCADVSEYLTDLQTQYFYEMLIYDVILYTYEYSISRILHQAVVRDVVVTYKNYPRKRFDTVT